MTPATRNMDLSPTTEIYGQLVHAFQFFNGRLFDNRIPGLIFTLTRKPRTMGYAAAKRWSKEEQRDLHEIAINPDYWDQFPQIEIAQTLVHEMCHIEQYEYGKPSRNGYHNKEWGTMMKRVGLMPSNTGKPGGKETGQSVADYPIDGGPFLAAWDELVATGFEFNYRDKWARRRNQPSVPGHTGQGSGNQADQDSEDAPGASGKRIKYRCDCECKAQVWGKAGLKIGCLTCGTAFEPDP